MDIDLLSKMVKELILDNDKVVLPGLGSFVAEIVPSTFTDRGYTINPPYRKMYFREKPDEGHRLAEFYAAENEVDVEVAEKIIADFITDLKKTLYTKKVVVFPGLGRLRATKENNVFFIADENLDIYPEGFGLEPVSLKTHEETSEEVAAAVEDLKSILDTPEVPEETQEEILEDAPEETPEETPEEEAISFDELTEEILPENQPEPEPESEQEPEQNPEQEPEQESEQESEPESEDDPDPDPESESESESDPDPDPDPEITETPKKKNAFGTIMIILIILASLFFAALAYVGRNYPELIDKYLYTPEELELLNRQ